jgi:hypothetical protein
MNPEGRDLCPLPVRAQVAGFHSSLKTFGAAFCTLRCCNNGYATLCELGSYVQVTDNKYFAIKFPLSS